MSDAVYERYKEALRQGHLASVRGRHDAALAAYAEAASIAPERALPHASIGAVYLRLGRPVEAATAYTAALERAPTEEAVLAGAADAYAALGRRADAADLLDRLAAQRDAAGRQVDALDAARRALELAESRSRRRLVEDLIERLRAAGGADAEPEALTAAVALLEASAVTVAPIEPADGTAEPSGPEPPPADPFELVSEAERAIDAGDDETARARLLAAASRFAVIGRPSAALDACYAALAVAPSDPDLHLTLVDLYIERGWRTAAAEKVALVARLAELSDDPTTLGRARAVAAARLRDEPSVKTLTG
jgi:tetratricopeptide (TPR) repeat protein